MLRVATKNPWFFMNGLDPQARMYLFCFPYAGGTAQMFNSWQAAFAQRTGIQVCPVQYPGRGNRLREPLLTDCRLMVEAFLPHMLPLLEKPFALFGHSMGAIIAFEVARALRRERGLEPVHMFVSGRRAPQVPSREPHTYNLPDDEFTEELRRLNGTPRQVLENAELMQVVLRIVRGDFALTQTYVYTKEPLLTCPISIFGGLDDTDVTREDLAAWCEQTTGACSLRMFEGDHFFIQSAENSLLAIVSEELSRL
jgi:medium-chain acyl-[acyl-carrier-protein] hydrolase